MSLALRGDLRDFPVADVFRLIAAREKSGRLRLRGESGSLLVDFDGGAILEAFPVDHSKDRALCERLVPGGLLDETRAEVHLRGSEVRAEAPADRLRKSGEGAASDLEADRLRRLRDSLYDALGWRSGSFEFEAQGGAGAVACVSGSEVEGLLHEVESQRALADTWGDALPAEKACLACTAPRAELSLSGIDPATRESAIVVLGVVEAGRRVREVIERSQLGTFEASRAIVALLRAGILRVEARSQGPRVRRHGSARAAIVAPVAALLAVVLMMLVGGSGADHVPEPFERSRALFEESAERSRAALLALHEGAPAQWVAVGVSVR